MWLRDWPPKRFPTFATLPAIPGPHAFFGVVQRDAKNILAQSACRSLHRRLSRVGGEVGDRFAGVAGRLSLHVLREHPRPHDLYANAPSSLTHDRFDAAVRAASRDLQPLFVASAGSNPRTVQPDTGMIWSAFRPSDDPVTYRFNVPQNAFAVIAMRLLARFAREAFDDPKLAGAATTLADGVQVGIERYGRTWDATHGWMYVYETDGYRERQPDGRCQYSQPDGAAVPRLVRDRRSGVPAHARIHAQLRQSVLLHGQVRDRFGKSAHAEGMGLAAGHRRRRAIHAPARRDRPFHRHARPKRHAQRVDAPIGRPERSVALPGPSSVGPTPSGRICSFARSPAIAAFRSRR